MNRRTFIKLILASAGTIIFAPPAWPWHNGRTFVVRAVPPRRFPGRIIPYHPASIRAPSDWAG